jgi:hypothetical protein
MTEKKLTIAPSGQLADADSFDDGGLAGDVLTKTASPGPGLPPGFAWQFLGSLSPLTGVVWVDGSTAVPSSRQTGSILAPFATITAAVAALAAGGTVLIIPGDYSAEPAVAVPFDIALINMAGLQYGSVPLRQVTLPSLVGNGSITIQGCHLANVVQSVLGSVTTQSCVISADITAQLLYQDWYSSVPTRVTFSVAAIGAVMVGTSFSVPSAASDFALPAGGLFSAKGVTFSPADTIVFAAGVAGDVQLDGASYYSLFNASLAPITNGNISHVYTGWSRIVTSVLVPALGATVLGYLDVSVAATELAPLNPNVPVFAAPRADLAGGGAGSGYFVGCRVSAVNTVRMTFIGSLAGGNTDFTISTPFVGLT